MTGGWMLTLLGLAVLALYVGACAWWPFRACPVRHCQGGRVKSPSGKAWRKCWWCGGKGSRVRIGRRVFDAVRGKPGSLD